MTETHLIRNANDRTTGTFISVPVSSEVPAGYVPLGTVPFKGSLINYIAMAEREGCPCLYRRADGMVVARNLISAREADEIVWSERRRTEVYAWAPTLQ